MYFVVLVTFFTNQ